MAADNDLYSYALGDLSEMEDIGSTNNVNIIVIFDGPSQGDSRYYYVQQGSLLTVGTPGELNMGDEQTVKTTVGWAFNNYPANHYALVFWDHGSGWHKDNLPTYKYVCYDDSSGGDALDNTEIDGALAWLRANTPASVIDLIGFDACLMQMIEIAYYLKDDGNVMVGSEETEGGDGWAYNQFLNYLVATPTMTAATLGTKIAQAFVAIPDSTLSALDLSKISNLATKVDALAINLISAGGTSNSKIYNAFYDTLYFYDYDYVDLYDFANNLIAQNVNTNINSAAAALKTAQDAAVIYHGHGFPQYAAEHGISIYFPDPNYSSYDSAYGDLDFAIDTHWDEFIEF